VPASRNSLRAAGWGGGDQVGDRGESALLFDLVALAGSTAGAAEVGPGDDAAGWRPTPGSLVLWSTDGLCEGTDFRRQYQRPYQVGWKAWMAAVSDLAAMGAVPRGGLLAAALPGSTSALALHAIQLGVVEAAAVDGAAVMGGDLSRIDGPLSLNVTVMGEVTDGPVVRLGGGSAGDWLVVTGSLGLAAAALHQLEEGMAPLPPEWRQRLLEPPSRVSAGVALRAAGATAMTDLSDGLLLDLGRLCASSRVGAEIWLDRLPIGQGLGATGKGEELALVGGEDFELLAAFPERLVAGLVSGWPGELPPVAVIGQLTAHAGTRLLRDRGGDPVDPPARAGFRHF